MADILAGAAMAEANAIIRAAHEPDDDDGGDGKDTECTPGYGGSSCNPRT